MTCFVHTTAAVGRLQKDTIMDELTRTFITRGDLAHLALFLWAAGATALLGWALRELVAANRRFNDFVREIATLNQLFQNGGRHGRETERIDKA